MCVMEGKGNDRSFSTLVGTLNHVLGFYDLQDCPRLESNDWMSRALSACSYLLFFDLITGIITPRKAAYRFRRGYPLKTLLLFDVEVFFRVSTTTSAVRATSV